jgi:hypothetical protein
MAVLDREVEPAKSRDYGRSTVAVVAGTLTVRKDVGDTEDCLRVIPATLINKVVDQRFTIPIVVAEVDGSKFVALSDCLPHMLSR